MVGIWETELSSCPQEEQNRLSGRFSAEHFGHWIIRFSYELGERKRLYGICGGMQRMFRMMN
jgi:hypothetical protein